MTELTGTRNHARVLNGIAHCAHCGNPLLKIGVNFTCPTLIADETDACPTQPINAQELLRAVVEQLIKRTINEQTTAQLVNAIQDEYANKSRRAQDNLDRTEAAITELNALKGRVVHPVEHGDSAYSEVADQIEEINQQTLGLSFEARLFRKEVDGYDFVTDEARIKANALDTATYLESATPEDTRDLLNLFVSSVDVANDGIVVHYTDQVPAQAQPDGKPADRVSVA